MSPRDISSKEYYSEKSIAEGYDAERFTSIAGKMFDRFEKEMVISHLPRNDNIRILDVGAGSGRFTIEMAKKGFRVVSCDYSREMLKIINFKINNLGLDELVSTRKEDITNLTFNDNEFDFISCIRVSVNLDTKENFVTGLNELQRVCKPGGTIVFDIVNPKSLAILGPKKSSMITLKEIRKILSTAENIENTTYIGRRILSQSAFEKTPVHLLGLIDKLDYILSNIFTSFCVRIYVIVQKK